MEKQQEAHEKCEWKADRKEGGKAEESEHIFTQDFEKVWH